MKEKLKKLSFVKKIINWRIRNSIRKEFLKEFQLFDEHCNTKKIFKERIEYMMLLNIHAIEKGLTNLNPRPFGKEKIDKLIYLMQEYDKLNIPNSQSFAYSLTLGILNSYIIFYEENNWTEYEEYKQVKNFMQNYQDQEQYNAGAYSLKKEDFIQNASIDYFSFLASRHYARSYKDVPLKEEDIEKSIQMAILSPSSCNRQMCKIWHIKTSKKAEELKKYLSGLGNFNLKNKINFFVITFDMDNYLFVSDRHEGWFNAGLMAMNFVNALHSLGIGSCFLQFGCLIEQEEELKTKLDIPLNNRIAIVVAAGYYEEEFKIPYSTRKNIEDIYFEK